MIAKISFVLPLLSDLNDFSVVMGTADIKYYYFYLHSGS